MRKYVILMLVVGVVVVGVIVGVDSLIGKSNGVELTYGEFYQAVERDQIAEVTISGHDISGTLKRGREPFSTRAPDDPGLIPELRKHRVGTTYGRGPHAPVLSLLVNSLPFLVMAVLLAFLLRQAQKRSQAIAKNPACGGVLGYNGGLSIAGYVNGDGTISTGSGFTVSRGGVGTYTVSCPAPAFSSGFPAMTVTPWGGGPPAVATVESTSAAGGVCAFVVRIWDTGGQPQDGGFTFSIART